jgi:hypothetical protein
VWQAFPASDYYEGSAPCAACGRKLAYSLARELRMVPKFM